MKLKHKRAVMRKSLQISGFLFLLLISSLSASLFIIAPITLNRLLQNVGIITVQDVVAVVLLLVSGYIAQYASVFLKNDLVQKYHIKVCRDIYMDVFALKYDNYLKLGPTAIQDRAYETIEAYADFFLSVVPDLLINSIIIIASVVVTFFINPLAALLLFSTLPIHYIGFKLLNKKLSELSIDLRKTGSESAKCIHAIISQVDFIKQNPNNHLLLPLIAKQAGISQNARKKVNNIANGVSGLLIGASQVVQAVLIIYLAVLALSGKTMFGDVVYVMLVLPYFSNAVRALSATNLGFAEVKAADDFMLTLLDEAESDGGQPAPNPINSIAFDIKEVVVGDRTLIRDVKMEFSKGDVVGIFGESGKGKSTLAKLIAKYRGTNGVSINGVPLSEISNSEYRKVVSYYSQNVPIVTDTLLNNLHFGRDAVDETEYRKIEFLDIFDNLDELILENGSNLSSGDKQRIALSRFFTETAQVVILDEPTSSLDSFTEEMILSSMLKDTSEKIVFLISHNSEHIRYCTHIVTIVDGRVSVQISSI